MLLDSVIVLLEQLLTVLNDSNGLSILTSGDGSKFINSQQVSTSKGVNYIQLQLRTHKLRQS